MISIMNLLLFFSQMGMSQTPFLGGGVNGGGGRAIVCKGNNNKSEVTTLDLYEGAHFWGIESIPNGTWDDLVKIVAKRIQTMEWFKIVGDPPLTIKDLEDDLNSTKNRLKFTSGGVGLTPVPDSFDLIQPAPGCESEQLAIYMSLDTIVVSKKLWDQMTPLNQMALVLHELMHREYRELGIKDSREARYNVAQLLAKNFILKGRIKTNPDSLSQVFKCESERDKFFIFNEKGKTYLQLTSSEREPIFHQTRVEVYKEIYELLELGGKEHYSISTQLFRPVFDTVDITLSFDPDTKPAFKISIDDVESGFKCF